MVSNEFDKSFEGLKKLYPQKGGSLFGKKKNVHAVDGVNFELREKEIFGIIGVFAGPAAALTVKAFLAPKENGES